MTFLLSAAALEPEEGLAFSMRLEELSERLSGPTMQRS